MREYSFSSLPHCSFHLPLPRREDHVRPDRVLFCTGTDRRLSLPVSNTYSSPIEGTLRFTTIQQLPECREYPDDHEKPDLSNCVPGRKLLPQRQRRHIQRFPNDQDPDSLPVHGFRTCPHHFPGNPYPFRTGSLGTQTNRAFPFPVQRYGLPGGLGNSSVQLAQQAVSAQQQAGVDTGSTSLQSSASSSQNGQMFQNTSVLKAQIQQAAAQMDAARNTFNQALAADPLLRQVNKTLTVDGFFRQSVTTNPSSGDNGTFAMIYQDRTGEQVNLQGALIKADCLLGR